MVQILAFLVLLALLFLIYQGALLLLQREAEQGVKRAAYALSGLWVVIPLLVIWAQSRWLLSDISQDAWMAWLLLAVLPNIIFWTLIWVLKGFRKENNTDQ